MEHVHASYHPSLAPAMLKHIQRLGGGISLQTPAEQMIINGFRVPEPIRQFLFDVTWPEHVTFENTDELDISQTAQCLPGFLDAGVPGD